MAVVAALLAGCTAWRHNMGVNEYQGRLLRARDGGPGAVLVTNECDFDATIRRYVEQHERPDYVYEIDLNSVQFMYVDADTLVTFKRHLREYTPSSYDTATEPIPEYLSSAFEPSDQVRLRRVRAGGRAPAAARARP